MPVTKVNVKKSFIRKIESKQTKFTTE